ncbi:myb-binding 1A [Brachionus plicatilis]|uniref:Myb-binding 1A n=1 Tax=Brachionus plicatilis TaxID=10195 RepID=A0A3M7QMC5_BRAPC|nr:myb-binding 1A [Brachionus plicatilis]
MQEMNGQPQASKKERKKDKSKLESNGILKKNGAKNSKEHAKMMEAFWKLSEFNQNTRLDGVQQIIKYLSDQDPVKNKEQINYVLNRLIRGLASNRKCSRIGFSSCLTEIINSFSQISFQSIFEMAKSNLNLLDSQLTKEELRHMQIGLVFVYLCWIQSNRFNLLKDNELKILLKDLNEFRKNPEFKQHTQSIYLQAECLLIKKISTINKMDMVFAELDADIVDAFKLGEKAKSVKDSLEILLLCLNSANMETRKFLEKKNLKLKTILHASNFDFFYELVSQSTESLPNIQPLITGLVDYLTNSDQIFYKQLWSDLVEAKLATRKEMEKKLLAFKLFLYSLSQVNKQNFNSIFYGALLTSENVIQIFVHHLSNRMSNLNQLFRTDIKRSLIDIIKSKEAELVDAESTLGADLVIKMLAYSKNYHDMSDLVSSIVSVLNKKSQLKLFKFLIKDFLHKDFIEYEKLKNGPEKEAMTDELVLKETWMLNQINNLARASLNYADNDQLIANMLYYLSLNSYFDVDGKQFDQFELGTRLVKSEKLANNLRERLMDFVGAILNKQNNNQVDLNGLLINACESIRQLIMAKKSPLADKFAGKEKELANLSEMSIKLLKALNSKDKSEADNKIVYQSFSMCVLVEFFRMFDSTKSTKQSLDDIEVCVQKFEEEKGKKSKKKKKCDDDEFEWIDVLVEMLLNLFTLNTNSIRNLVKNQFKKLLPKLSVNSVKLIVDLLSPESDEDLLEEEEEMEDEEVSEEEEELEEDMIKGDLFMSSKKSEEEESGIEDVSMSPSSDKNEKKKDQESESSSESEDEKSQVDEELKKNLMKALGNAVAKSDDDNSDLDDDAMMKLDETLAAVFKVKKKDKQRQNDLLQYKLRVLDLVQEIFKSNNRLDLIAYAIKPLLEILFESQTKPDLKLISQRILSFLVNIKQTCKKLNESKMPEIDDLFELLSYLLECSAIHLNVTKTLIETSMFCVRLIQHIAQTNKAESVNIVKKLNAIYLDIIKNEKSKVNPAMYKEYLVRYSAYSAPIISQMIDSASQPDTKLHKKTVTLITLNQCISAQMFNESELGQTEPKQLVEKIFKFFDKITDDILKDENLHIKFVDAFLNLASKVLINLASVLRSDLLEGFSSKLTLVSKDSKLKQAYKSRLLNLIQVCNRTINSLKST